MHENVDFIVCGRVGDERTANAPGSVTGKCSDCGNVVRIHPSTIKTNLHVPIICLQCAMEMSGMSDVELKEQGIRLDS
jgi:hypothetical protein